MPYVHDLNQGIFSRSILCQVILVLLQSSKWASIVDPGRFKIYGLCLAWKLCHWRLKKNGFGQTNPVLRCTSKGATRPAKNRDGFPRAALDRLIFVLVTSLIHISAVDPGHFQDRRSVEFYSSYIRYFVHTLPGIARSSKLS
jgi:hypothetical protein